MSEDEVTNIDQIELASLTDDFTRGQVKKFASTDFASNIESLLSQIQNPSIRSNIRVHASSFDAIMELSQLRWNAFAPTTGLALLGGFLYTAIHLSVRQAEADGHSKACFEAVIEKLRRCNDLGTEFYSRCSDPALPENYKKERLEQAYRLLLSFTSSIVKTLEHATPLVSLDDARWDNIAQHETSCTRYLEESTIFLSNVLDKEKAHKDDPSLNQEPPDRDPPVHVLPKRLARFFGRDKELKDISERLNKHNSVTLRGIAGVGKTSVALQFAYQSLSDYRVIIWIRCEPSGELAHSCQEALRRLGAIDEGQKQVPEIRKIWQAYFAKLSFRWLVIFDNVVEKRDVEPFWPQGHGKILVTTQKRDIAFRLTDYEIEINPFATEEGRDCIMDLLAWPGGVPADAESAAKLNEELGGLPLGILQMTSVIRDRKSTVQDFLRLYEKNKVRYHAKETEIEGIAPKSDPRIATNWQLPFDLLEDEHKSLLGILSLLSASTIPETLFKHWDECEGRSTSGLLDFCDDEDDFMEVEEKLFKLSLVDKDPATAMLSLHRLEQSQFEIYMDAPTRQVAFDRAAKLLHDVFPKEHIGQRFTGKWDDCNLYIQHANVLNSHYLKVDKKTPKYKASPEFAKLMAWCSWYLFEIADYPNFEVALCGGRKACKEAGTAAFDDSTWALLNYNAGTVETSRGMFKKAKESLDESLKVRRNLDNDDDVAATLNNLGILHSSMGEFDIAEQYFTEALAIHETRHDTEDRKLSMTMVKHNLLRTTIQSGKDLPSVEDVQSTIDIFHTTISWWMTGHSYLPLGNLYLQLGEYEKATIAFTAARDILSAPGRAASQPATAMTIYKLGRVAYVTQNLDKAADYFRESIMISQEYPLIPAEEARTQFMLLKALDEGANSIRPNEEEEVRQRFSTLMKLYYDSVEARDPAPVVELAQLDVCITAKYQ